MARQLIIPVADDGEILTSSPVTILDTKYYEVWLQVQGNSSWAQYTFDSPLPLYATNSPSGQHPGILITPLADATIYNYQVRRFNSNNQPSTWVSGSYTTG